MQKRIDKSEILQNREIIFYKNANTEVKVEILLYNENMWLTQAKMAELYGVNSQAISKHLKNIFEEGELNKNLTCSKMEQVQNEGNRKVSRMVEFYNLDAIIAVGYRVNSSKATMFRIWANKTLKEYIIKGYVMNDERLKNPDSFFGKDYFEEQLERIRDIRSSERRFYQKITDIYSKCSADYDSKSEITKKFFSTVQNKLHYAVSHQTAAEIIYNRVNHQKENLGLTTWKNAPNGDIRKTDIVIAKNYLNQEEIKNLNEIVSMYLDYAERQAKRFNVMYMEDWIKKLDAFLQFNEEDILLDKGKISHELAIEKAENEFAKYKIIQDKTYKSDFDKFIEEVSKLEKINSPEEKL